MNTCSRAARALALSLTLIASTAAQAVTPSETADFDNWLDKVPTRRAEVRAFEDFLQENGVAGVLPTREILLNDTSWSMCGKDGPYTLAERSYWKNIIGTLRYIRDEVVPSIGPVRVESGYRDAALNNCAGGATHSAHAQFYALDLEPVRDIGRAEMLASVCANHARYGAAYHVGLGFYEKTRFHIDSRSFRRWGPDYHAGTSPCIAVEARRVAKAAPARKAQNGGVPNLRMASYSDEP
jgi:hypothetical protein